MTPPVRGRARRRWRLAACGTLLAALAFVVALPWLLQLPAVQRRMAAHANKVMAPSSVEFGAIRLSWFKPTEITRFVLRDAHGAHLVATPRATFGWNLWQLLVIRPKTVTLDIPEGNLDIERAADGTVNLYETLRPVISERPPIRLKIRIHNARMSYRDPAFAAPMVADQARLMLDLGRNSEPITWDIHLVKTGETAEPGRLAIVGEFSRVQVDPAGRHDLTLSLEGARWPWALASSLLQAGGELTGTLGGDMRMGRLRIAGDATFTDLTASGSLVSSDTVHLDTMRARVKMDGNDGAWSVETLELKSAIASVTGEGSFPPTAAKGGWLEAAVDLAAMARQLPATLHLRDDLRVERGAARLRADVALNADGHTENWNVAGKVSDLAARHGQKRLTLPEPAALTAKLERQQAATKLERLDIQSRFLTATGQGDLDRGIAVTATLDLAAFCDRFRDWIELGPVELAGVGKLDARYQRQGEAYRAGVNASFRDLRIVGLPMVEKLSRDQVTIEGKIGGRSTELGWPLAWREASVQAMSGETELAMSVLAGPAAGEFAASGRASTVIAIATNGPKHRLEAELNAKTAGGRWTTDRLALAVVRPAKPGAGAPADEAIRWEGKGRYDSQRDELIVESITAPSRPPIANETWITGNQKLRTSGLRSRSAAQIEVEATADLKSLGRWLAPENDAWTGHLSALAHARRDQELWDLGLKLAVRDSDRSGGDGLARGMPGNVEVTINGAYAPRSDRLDMTELTMKAPNLQVEGAGMVSDVTSHASVDLKGSLDLDWNAIGAVLARKVEPNARITGRPRAWRLAGTIDGLPSFDRMGSLEGDIGAQIDSLDVFGMRLSAVPLVLRSAGGRLTIDPIDAKLNGGDLHLEPELVRGEGGSTWLHLGPHSTLDGAVVNDEVSHRVLSYAAPILDGATRVEGEVSFKLADADFPISAGPEAEARIEGDLLFDDVRFMPGPLADQIIGVFQRERRPLAVLRDPITVRIAGRKVYQQGLNVPVAGIASIGLDGSVDFDQNLDLVARFAFVPPDSGVPILNVLMANARFDLPIRGTLKNPKIDGAALKERFKGMGPDVLGNAVEGGVNGLRQMLRALPPPRLRGLMPQARRDDPPAPPRPAVPDGDPGQAPGNRPAPPAEHQVLKPPDNAADRPAPLTRQEKKKQLRQERRQERLQRKADRQAKK